MLVHGDDLDGCRGLPLVADDAARVAATSV
jgi:hypothetical protein